ncbi:MAG: sigma-54-dependent Fis family transcriptional regulator, partial [Candidatus Zixiibacteriota bacterium]
GYAWPGNIRELENLIERMVILRKSEVLTFEELPDDFAALLYSRDAVSDSATTGRVTFHEAEQKLIIDALNRSSWNKSKAAKYLNIPRHVLIYRMKKYGITNGTTVD